MSYLLPDKGTSTTSQKRYVEAWRNIGEPIARHLGVDLIAWDPHFLFRRESGTTFTLPMDVAVKLHKLVLLDLACQEKQAKLKRST